MEDPAAIRTQADDIIRERFGIEPPSAELRMRTKTEWRTFLEKSARDPQTVGNYSINTRIASVLQDHPQWISTLYHEIHGHALMHERSKIGERYSKGFPAYDAPLPADIAQWGFLGTHRLNSEGFATWMERYLCEATDREQLWQRVRRNMPPAYSDAYDAASAVAARLSPTGFLRQMGIPVPITPTRASGILRAMSAGRRVELAAILPSARAEDPVRVLIVSDDRPPIRSSPWLTPRVISSERLITETVQEDRVLEREATAGEFLFGDAYAWRRVQERFSKRAPIG